MNKARFRSNISSEKEAVTTVYIDRAKDINKLGGAYDPRTKEIKWKVELNYQEKSIDNSQLIDSWEAGTMELVGDIEFIEMEIMPDGKAKMKSSADINYDWVKNDDSGFHINLAQLDKAYLIQYKTKLKNKPLSSQLVKNTASWNGDESQSLATIVSGELNKIASKINYLDKTILWESNINEDYEKISNLKIEDRFKSPGLYFKEDSLILTIDGKRLVKDKDYLVSSKKNGFDIDLQGDYKTINKPIKLEYLTNFSYQELIESDQDKYHNYIKAIWTLDNGGQWDEEGNAYASLNQDYIDNGNKLGSYDKEKNKINWQVFFNYQKNPYESLIVKDLIEKNQKLDRSSLKLYKIEGSKDDYKIKEEIKLKNIDYKTSKEGEEINLTLGKFSDRFLLEYQTSLDGFSYIEEVYTNIAKIYNEGKEISKLYASINTSTNGKYISKKGIQEDSRVKWQVIINESQAYLKNIVFNDILSDNQEFLDHTIKVYTSKLDSKGQIIKDKLYSKVGIDLDKKKYKELNISFEENINRPFIIEYETIYFANNNDSLENTYEIKGQEINEKIITKGKEVVKVKETSGASAQGKVGFLIIEKVDDDDPNIKLEGVEFQLLDPITKEIIKSGKTDENGLLYFGRLLFGEYELREISSNDGYIKPEKTIKIVIDKEYNAKDEFLDQHIIRIKNKKLEEKSEKIDIKVHKIWKNAPKIKPTIKIQLYRDGQKHQGPIELRSGENTYIFKNLDKYDDKGRIYSYTVDEVDTPYGYKKELNQKDFTITNTFIEENIKKEKIDVLARKTWINQEGNKPTIYFKLYRKVDGEEFLPVSKADIKKVGSSNTVIWKSLEKRDSLGRIYTYGVEEVDSKGNNLRLEDYKKEGEFTLNIRNIFSPSKSEETIYYRVDKKWIAREDNRKDIIIKLLANGKEINRKVLKLGKDSLIFDNLRKYDDEGKKINYQVEEIFLEGFKTSRVDRQTSYYYHTIFTNTYEEPISPSPIVPEEISPNIPDTSEEIEDIEAPKEEGVDEEEEDREFDEEIREDEEKQKENPTTGDKFKPIFLLNIIALSFLSYKILSHKINKQTIN